MESRVENHANAGPGMGSASSDETPSTISSAVAFHRPADLNPECQTVTPHGLTLSVSNRYLIRHFRQMSPTDLLQECHKAIRIDSIVDKGVTLVGGATQLDNGNIRVLALNKSNLLTLKGSQSWVDILLANGITAMKINGVVAHVFRNSKTALNHKQDDAPIWVIVKANKPRLASLRGPQDIRNMEWLCTGLMTP